MTLTDQNRMLLIEDQARTIIRWMQNPNIIWNTDDISAAVNRIEEIAAGFSSFRRALEPKP